ncbi:MAG: heparin lyase I family protein [Planctomycetota bacterium]
MKSEDELELWNLYIPMWAPIGVVGLPEGNRVLQLADESPYDYACAERHFPPNTKISIEFSVFIKDFGKDILEFELRNERDRRALRMRFDVRQVGITFDLGGTEVNLLPISANKWYDVKLTYDCDEGEYDLWLDGKRVVKGVEFDIKTRTLERMVFRTGSWRSDVRQFFIDAEPSGPGLDGEDLAASGEKVPQSVFWIDNVRTTAN